MWCWEADVCYPVKDNSQGIKENKGPLWCRLTIDFQFRSHLQQEYQNSRNSWFQELTAIIVSPARRRLRGDSIVVNLSNSDNNYSIHWEAFIPVLYGPKPGFLLSPVSKRRKYLRLNLAGRRGLRTFSGSIEGARPVVIRTNWHQCAWLILPIRCASSDCTFWLSVDVNDTNRFPFTAFVGFLSP